jgi:hypothetical protein
LPKFTYKKFTYKVCLNNIPLKVESSKSFDVYVYIVFMLDKAGQQERWGIVKRGAGKDGEKEALHCILGVDIIKRNEQTSLYLATKIKKITYPDTDYVTIRCIQLQSTKS